MTVTSNGSYTAAALDLDGMRQNADDDEDTYDRPAHQVALTVT